MKEICCLDLKCSIMFYFTFFGYICTIFVDWIKYFNQIYLVSDGRNMIIIRNMSEVIFPNIYILLNIIHYVLPVTIIIVLITI